MKPLGHALHWSHVQTLWHAMDWHDWAMWPLRRLGVLGLVLAWIGGLTVWLIWPQEDIDPAQYGRQRLALQVEQGQQNARLAALVLASNETAVQTRDLTLMQREWPTSLQARQVVLDVYQQAKKHGLQVDTFKPELVQTKNTFSIHTLSLRLHGSFSQIMAWRDDAFAKTALWVPEKWIMTATPPGQVTLEALLHLYVTLDDEMPPAPLTQSPMMVRREVTALSATNDPFGMNLSHQTEGPPLLNPVADVHPLRRWSLQDMKMVGSVQQDGEWHALVLTPAGLFRLIRWDRVGAEGGMVVAIQEAELRVRIPVQDKAGGWRHRLDVLRLMAQK